MAKDFKPRIYQEFMFEHAMKHKKCGLFSDMGTGKTVTSLTVMREVLDRFLINRPLVISTKRVCESVWCEETQEWTHTKHLKGVKVLGSAPERVKALNTPADFHVINRENVVWLVDYYKSRWPFDMVIVDESSSFKNHASKRFKALKLIRTKVDRVILLTGTPAPNGYLDLWSQLYLLDGGERLGTHITHYRAKYFLPSKMDGHVVLKYAPKDNALKVIQKKISDICVSIKSRDYIKDLPAAIDNKVRITLPNRILSQYTAFEREQVLKLKDTKITAVNRAVLINKLLQFANGTIYDENGEAHEVHRLKLDAMAEVLDEANGNPVLCAYTFKSDAARLIKEFGARVLKTKADVIDWNRGKIPFLIAHPASAGHGLNLQFGGHILAWFGFNWSLELTEQFDKRIDRPGQKYTVIKNKLTCLKTMDEDVLAALTVKGKTQDMLINAVKARIKKYW